MELGVNTDPKRSRGRLCADFHQGFPELLRRLRAGEFKWLPRQRIEVALLSTEDGKQTRRVLPQLALNEVFAGEEDPTRASILKLKADGVGPWRQHKCSGLLINTGTGASAWAGEAGQVTETQAHAMLAALARETSAADAKVRGIEVADTERLMDLLERETPCGERERNGEKESE
ncbi:hypothetical protein T484DRAFT_1825501 [Baffinella frigidus]|nr:hypothetical protein T484DRAFT_1825501 [Cryptophyta sp. CCMP2293]